MTEVRTRPADGAAVVASLPRRLAHLVFALIVASREYNGPVTPAEIAIYDQEAMTMASVYDLLRRALEEGLADRWGHGIYVPTLRAGDLAPWLEDRVLEETS